MSVSQVTNGLKHRGAGTLDAREAMLKAKELFLKISDPDEGVARRAVADFRSLMDEWGINLENMYRFPGRKWRPLAHRAVEFWRESRESTEPVDLKFRRPKRERQAWLLAGDNRDSGDDRYSQSPRTAGG